MYFSHVNNFVWIFFMKGGNISIIKRLSANVDTSIQGKYLFSLIFHKTLLLGLWEFIPYYKSPFQRFRFLQESF